jgi:glycosyltransferase involved in cell wall biosynthesis
MNVVVLSDFETYGGAAIATSRLVQGLSDAGLHVTRIVAHPDGKEHPWKTIPLHQRRFMDRIVGKSNLKRLEDLLGPMRPHVINLHNIHGALTEGWSIDFLNVCQKLAPTIWTLHDMWSFTGRCAYSYDCRKFIDGCDANCPTPTEYPQLEPDQIHSAWLNRKNLLEDSSKLTCITPSSWMAREAREGLWKKARIEVIPNGLPLEIFKPVDRAEALKELGIQPTGIVMIAVAQDFDERRKGGSYLQEALNQIVDEDLTLLIMGEGRIRLTSTRVKVHHLGFVNDDQKKALAYNAADFIIHPAPVDNCPNVLVETFACGTPAVGFDVCGIPELVRPGVTGWLAGDVNSTSLRNAIETAIQDIRNQVSLRKSCRQVAESEYPLPLQAKRYSDLFSQLISS